MKIFCIGLFERHCWHTVISVPLPIVFFILLCSVQVNVANSLEVRNGTANNSVAVNYSVSQTINQCCVCPNKTLTEEDLKQKQLLKLEKEIKLARDVRQASTALTFILVLLVGSVLCTQMWKKHSHLPEHIDDENPLFKSTVSEVLSSIRKLRVKINKSSKHRRKRKKAKTEYIPLLDS